MAGSRNATHLAYAHNPGGKACGGAHRPGQHVTKVSAEVTCERCRASWQWNDTVLREKRERLVAEAAVATPEVVGELQYENREKPVLWLVKRGPVYELHGDTTQGRLPSYYGNALCVADATKSPTLLQAQVGGAFVFPAGAKDAFESVVRDWEREAEEQDTNRCVREFRAAVEAREAQLFGRAGQPLTQPLRAALDLLGESLGYSHAARRGLASSPSTLGCVDESEAQVILDAFWVQARVTLRAVEGE